MRILTLVGALAELLVARRLLDEVEDLGGERTVRQRVGLGVHGVLSLEKRTDTDQF